MDPEALLNEAEHDLATVIERRAEIEVEWNQLQGRIQAAEKLDDSPQAVDELRREGQALQREYREATQRLQMLQGEIQEYQSRLDEPPEEE